MDKLKFYEVAKEYLEFLKSYDEKVPNQDYKTNDKFFCGVVLNIEGFSYFVPVSHYTKQDRTNFVLTEGGKAIASLRFCFMIPVPLKALKYKDFSKENNKQYIELLSRELKICRDNEEEIKKIAHKVYKIGCNDKHYLNKVCCSFKKLEEVIGIYDEVKEKNICK